jgi:8-oxo-dGDP phosphatase
MKKKVNPWKKISSKEIYSNPWIKLQEDQIINPAGKPGIYGKICFQSQAVGIIPVDKEGNTWLVGQYRYTLNEWAWEIPMGGSPLGEDCQQTALRELEEETGLVAGNIKQIQYLHTSNSITDEQGYVFLATDLKPGKQQLEDTEQGLEVLKLPLAEAIKMAEDGKITDAISVAGLFYVALNAKKLGIKI